MRISTEAVLLRIHTSEQDKYGGKPFHEAVVKARETVRDHFPGKTDVQRDQPEQADRDRAPPSFAANLTVRSGLAGRRRPPWARCLMSFFEDEGMTIIVPDHAAFGRRELHWGFPVPHGHAERSFGPGGRRFPGGRSRRVSPQPECT